MMNRTTILLPNSLKREAEEKARALGLSLGELIRKALRIIIESQDARKTQKSRDSLFSDASVFRGKTPRNVSLDHDLYLYGDDK
ncbi:MAG: ribbon-helix-helix protein, CopG family [Deltaproteobacteria bacterium]|nr:ribbon-helix-helix protein, CopG family [Deltaproteobacteria bacterium]